MRSTNVAERGAATAFDEVFDDFMRTATPVILRGAARDWPARTKWTPDFLIANCGDATVDFMRAGERVQGRIADYFSISAAERANWYLVDWNFRWTYPELLDDIAIPELFAVDWLTAVPPEQRPDLLWIYMGHAGTRGRAHIDNYGSSAWLAVLQGSKRVVFPTPRNGTSLSAIDFFNDDADLTDVTEIAEATLQGGDILFVPAGRWHTAYNPEYCLSITANFVDGSNFNDHRCFATRHWYGRRMLASAVEQWSGMPPGPERDRLTRHLSAALQSYRHALHREVLDVEELAASLPGLDETSAVPR